MGQKCRKELLMFVYSSHRAPIERPGGAYYELDSRFICRREILINSGFSPATGTRNSYLTNRFCAQRVFMLELQVWESI